MQVSPVEMVTPTLTQWPIVIHKCGTAACAKAEKIELVKNNVCVCCPFTNI